MPALDRQCPISWPTRRLLMAEIANEDDGTGNSRDRCSSPGGETPATLQSALDAVQQGYEPYADFPSDLVREELKLLQKRFGKKYACAELLSDRDWKAHEACGGEAGDPPLEVQVDYDLAAFVREWADCNGIDTERYVNNLLEKAVLAEGGVGTVILNKCQTIGGHHVDAGTSVEAGQHHGDFSKRDVTVKVGRKTVEGVVVVADLLKPEEAGQDRALVLQRAKQALAGLNVAVNPLAVENEPGSHMIRVSCTKGDEATLKQARRRLKEAGLTAYTVVSAAGVLHVRANG